MKVPFKLKGKLCEIAVRPAMLYRTRCWTVKNQHENKLNVTEMMILCCMYGKIILDNIKNDNIREEVELAL